MSAIPSSAQVNAPTVNIGSAQYLRQLSLIVADKSGNGLDLAQLKVVFHVTQNSISTPNSLIARVYNPAPATINLIQQEFTQVQLSAGYGGNFGVIFRGLLKQRNTGREDTSGADPQSKSSTQRYGYETPVDTFIDIYASDGDTAYNHGVVNKTIAAGHTPLDHYNALAESLQPFGITGGATPESLGTNQNPRGRVCFGMTRNRLQEFADTNGLTYAIRDNQEVALQTLTGYDADEAIIINRDSGMIGIPQQTQGGIAVRTLLNPKLKYNKSVEIRASDILQAAPNLEWAAINFRTDISKGNQGAINSSYGTYKAVLVEHSGDTRGTPWYSDVVCVTVDGTLPITGPSLTSVP